MTPRLRTAGLRSTMGGLRSVAAGPFDVTLGAGECLAITGPSGAGKSLFLRMIADLDPNEGEAWLDGRPRSAHAAPEWRRRVAYNPAEPGWWHERVGDHFATSPEPGLRRLGLASGILGQPVRNCSTGERTRLALLRALTVEPAVLLLDEPTASLDQASREAVEALLRERMSDGLAIVLVTHDRTQAERLGTAQARIEAGRLT